MSRASTRDRLWVGLIVALFAFNLAASWQRWGNLLIDTGREMNLPVRLAGGETLYSDVRHIYGPLSPWLHAALFRLSGPSLAILYTDGILNAVIVLALVYWLGRQIMGAAAAGTATLSVMAICVFKPAGNYILPYSYNSLHGATLGLAALAVLVKAARTRRPGTAAFLLAGGLTGLTLLAKLEMGAAALAAGITAGVTGAYPDRGRGIRLAAIFSVAAAAIAGAGYGIAAARAGWSALVTDSWLLLYNVPGELAYYNAWVSGLANPPRSIWRMILAAVKLGILAATVAAAASLIARRRARTAHHAAAGGDSSQPDGLFSALPQVSIGHPWRLLGGAVALAAVLSLTTGLDWDKGPYLAMPFLLVGLLVMLIRERRAGSGAPPPRANVLTVCAVFALASLARMILHVRSGGAYASYLLPVSVVMFTYLWVGPFASRFRDARTAAAVRTIALTLIAGNAIVTSGILAYRYQTRHTVPVTTPRGTIIATADIGRAWNEALAFIDRHTAPGDAVAVMPEGTSLNFLSGRRHPLREEITTPGFLDAAGEERAIRQLRGARTALVLIANRPTLEFGAAAFGRDYNRRLMRWVDTHYQACAIFGPVKNPDLQIGDGPFFLRAYCRRQPPADPAHGTDD